MVIRKLLSLQIVCCAAKAVDPAPVTKLLQRVVGVDAAASFELSVDQAGWCDSPVQECASVAPGSAPGRIAVKGTSISSLAFGVGEYLRSWCNASLTNGRTGGLVAHTCTSNVLPKVTKPTVFSRSVQWTYYQNVVDSSYSFVWYNFDQWSREIDWMALTGVNIALMYTGQEKVLRDTYIEFGVNLSDTAGNADFFNGPAFLSWSRGQGQAGVGSSDAFHNASSGGALPEWWLDRQADLGKQQAARMRELGITTILRGFEGNVPGQLQSLYPRAKITQVSETSWLLDALDPLFTKLSDSYMKRLISTFGTDHYYQADGFFNHRSGPWVSSSDEVSSDEWPPADADAANHSAAAFAGLTRTDPKAVWVYQTWIWRGFSDKDRGYLRGWMSSIPEGRGLMLDQTAEMLPIWRQFGNWSFLGMPFIWCAMSNMGGNVGLYGDLDTLLAGPLDAVKENASIVGVGIDPEGVDTNPAYFHLLLSRAWRKTTAEKKTSLSDKDLWLQHWADMRCGKINDNARQAWALLGSTVYAHSSEQHYEHHMGYCPTTMPNGATWDKQRASERATWYSTTTLQEAWKLLIDAAADCQPSPAFTFDLVDVGREYLSVAPCNAAYDALVNASTASEVRSANASMSSLMLDLDRLLAASDGFLLGRWIADARQTAVSAGRPQDADFLEWNARAQVTSWFPSMACDGSATKLKGLWDYGNKAWSGLVAGYYDRRFHLYAASKLSKLTNNSDEKKASFIGSVMQLACEFQHDTSRLPSKAAGDAVAISKELLQKYASQVSWII